ncbi:MAG: translation initiation factor IF-2 [Ignavibacteriae bacterium]|nr:MAG: translation initiation factor IF-2 [Ignavibacteriota bacterium]
MSEQGLKKMKIFNLAKELNLSSETIIDFLKKKGFDVKSHMSSVSEEMMPVIMGHFKKDKEVAERHQRKIQEFRSTRKKESPEKTEVAEKGEKKPAEKEEIVSKKEEVQTALEEQPVKEEEETPTPAAEIPVVVQVTEVPLPEVEKIVLQEKSEQLPVSVVESKAAPEKQKGEVPGKEKPAGRPKKQVQTPLEAAVARSQRGLTIKGKIDLTPARAAQKPDIEEKRKKKKKKVREEIKKTKSAPGKSEDEEESKSRKRKRVRRAEVNEDEVAKAIRETLADSGDELAIARAAIRRKKKEKREEEEQKKLDQIEYDKMRIKVTEYATVGELANLMHVTVAEVIQKVMGLGIMVSINQRLDKDTITLVSDEFGFQVDFEEEFSSEALSDIDDDEETLLPRAPVVTIMGHVDHGKTSLLDHIRNENVVAGEAGGITQHIGAYEVTVGDHKQITFLDTPGHEAFTAMRARGAQVTDIVVLVVAADDSVMPQTVEAISHAQAANVPIIVAINKIDKPESNPERIKQQLAERGLLVEEYGGKHQVVELSAKKGTNVNLLLEKILLEAEMLNLRANPNREARGTLVEAELDKGKGIIATILVQKGTLRIGDSFVCGVWSGRVRAMFNERGQRVESAKPSQPVQVVGFDGIPQAGDDLIGIEDEHQAREISLTRQQLKREQDFRQNRRVTLDDISQQIKEGQVRDLPVIVKADVDGSAEALSDSLMKLSTEEVKVQVIYKGVGGISESDVLLAMASSAVIIGFHVRPNLKARQLAQHEDVDIRIYNIIYDAINDVRKALEGLLAPTVTEEVTATVEVRDVFKISKIGTIAGCYVRDGKIMRNNHVRLVRDGIEVFDGTIASLKRFKDDVKEVEQGFECGISLENFNDIKNSDIIEAYKTVETKRKLE